MHRRLLTGGFWSDTVERMIRAGASSALATIGVEQIGLLEVPWGTVGSLAGMAAVVSLLASIVAGTTTDPDTAGFTTHR